MIEIKNLHKNYRKHEVLKNISISLPCGEVSAVIGPNACGKSTLVKCILGLVLPQKGEIYMNGRLVNETWDFRNLIGYVPQYPCFPENLTAAEIFKMLDELRSKSSQDRREGLCRTLNLGSELHKPYKTLSGGTKQKVAIVSALAYDPSIVILDEPTASLDPISCLAFQNIVKDLTQNGKTILLVSHVLQGVEELAKNVIYLADGRVGFSGKVSELLMRTQTQHLGKALAALRLKTENIA